MFCKIHIPDLEHPQSQIDNLENYFGHQEINVEGEIYNNDQNKLPIIDEKANFSIGNHVKFVKGIKIC